MTAALRRMQSWALPLYWQWRGNSNFGCEDIAATSYSGLVLAVGGDFSVSLAGEAGRMPLASADCSGDSRDEAVQLY